MFLVLLVFEESRRYSSTSSGFNYVHDVPGSSGVTASNSCSHCYVASNPCPGLLHTPVFVLITQGKVEYVAVRAGKDECATPAKLVQNYVICRLDKKLDILLGFIKTHLKSKMIVFFTSCAQVRAF